ncbi:FAD-dependent oxidoreductase [bacterium]|nr:FAD-dependent oxidoreductase [bacterium]
MNKDKIKKAIILGGGPAGLAAAYELIEKDSNIQPIIIEKLPCVGGISRTVYSGKLGVDIGGHRLHTHDKYIESIWLKFLSLQNAPSVDDIAANRKIDYPTIGKNPNESNDVMLIRNRFSSIIYNSKFFPYPLKIDFNNFKKLGILTSFKAGFSYLKSSIFKRKETNLEDFMVNRFGKVLYEIFFKDYTKKLWGVDASQLSNEWGDQRIRKLSLMKTVLNSFLSSFKFLKFKKEKSLIDKFYYPKFGCSQLWDLMAEYIANKGGKIILNAEFVDFSCNLDNILSVKYKDSNGCVQEINADYVLSSIPISDLIKAIDVPLNIKQNALNLPYRDYILVSMYSNELNLKNYTDYKTVNNVTPDNWIYLQERDAIAGRIQIMNNWSPYLVEDFENKYLVSLEYFANVGDDLWSKTDDELISIALLECKKYNLFKATSVIKSMVIREQKAYPAYHGSHKNIDSIRNHIAKYKNLYLIGRNGQHKYCNMDEAMNYGIKVARDIILNR